MSEPARAPKTGSPERKEPRTRTGSQADLPGAHGRLLQQAVVTPSALSPQNVLTLQRSVGNRAVGRIFAAEQPPSPVRSNPMAMLQRMHAEHLHLSARPSASAADAAGVQRSFELNREKDVKVSEDHRAKEVYAENLRGEPLGPAANSPSVSPFGWDELWTAGHTLGNRGGNSSHYNAVRMHLWNGRLGGPGNETWNLAPGPAKVNSMMSAGPEMAAKLLVDAGYSVWIRTKVRYMNNSTNAKDFTSVVPNHIAMEWGVMGHKASGSWSTDIELPVAPLSGMAAQEYRDWDKDDPNGLVGKLSSVTDQVRAQAYDLVQHDELRLAILKAYPQIYLGMDALGQGGVLRKMPDPMLLNFMTNVLQVVGKPELLVEQVVFPLAESGDPLRAQKIFDNLSWDDQRKTIITYKWDLLQHLGEIAERFSTSDWTIFRYNPLGNQVHLLDAMERTGQIDDFLGARTRTERQTLFDIWAIHRGNVKPKDRLKFITDLTIGDKYKRLYRTAILREIAALKYRKSRGLGPLKTKTQLGRGKFGVTTNKAPRRGGVAKTSTNRFSKRKVNKK